MLKEHYSPVDAVAAAAAAVVAGPVAANCTDPGV
jgi:hypothetical protein